MVTPLYVLLPWLCTTCTTPYVYVYMYNTVVAGEGAGGEEAVDGAPVQARQEGLDAANQGMRLRKRSGELRG